MAAVLQNEFPSLELRCLDLDFVANADAAARRVIEAIATSSEERELQLNARGRAALAFARRKERIRLRPPHRADNMYRLQIGHAGRLDGFGWRSVSRQTLEPHEVEIAVAATGLNFRDVSGASAYCRRRHSKTASPDRPSAWNARAYIGGRAGGEETFALASAWWRLPPTAFASHVVVDATVVAPIPDEISSEAAATLPVAFFTAYYALVHLARLQAGESVLIHGARAASALPHCKSRSCAERR